MSLINQYWQQRERFKIFSEPWFRAWAKRLRSIKSLWQASRHGSHLKRKGASLGSLTWISPAVWDGDPHKLRIGNQCFIGRATIQLHGGVIIGNRACINDGVRIYTASHDVRDPNWTQIEAQVVIEDYAWIASAAIILPELQ